MGNTQRLQSSHTLSCLNPFSGAQLPQTTRPQFLQWCLRNKNVNERVQIGHFETESSGCQVRLADDPTFAFSLELIFMSSSSYLRSSRNLVLTKAKWCSAARLNLYKLVSLNLSRFHLNGSFFFRFGFIRVNFASSFHFSFLKSYPLFSNTNLEFIKSAAKKARYL